MLIWPQKQERGSADVALEQPVRAPDQFTDGLSRVPMIERMTIRRMEGEYQCAEPIDRSSLHTHWTLATTA